MTTPPLKHPSRIGTQNRVRLGGGPMVDYSTLADFQTWRSQGLSHGQAIDRLRNFARQHGFDPVMMNHASVVDPSRR